MPNATNTTVTEILAAGDTAIATAASSITQGHPVAVPTETVYGLAADARNAEAIARIYDAKGRPAFNPLIVHVADLTAAERLAHFDKTALLLAERFWPGPLTLVLPKREDSPIASIATAGLETIAIRIPAHPVMRALLAACECPLAAPSANASGRISPTTAAHVVASLGGRIALVIDGGPCQAGLESTIVRTAGHGAEILRPGPVTREMLAQATGLKVTLAYETPDLAISAPGQLASHYAPRKPLAYDVTSSDADDYVIGFGATDGDFNLSAHGDLAEAAARLFDALHAADASDALRIVVAPIPDCGIGRAINDRLRRATA